MFLSYVGPNGEYVLTFVSNKEMNECFGLRLESSVLF